VEDPILFGLASKIVQIPGAFQSKRRLGGKGCDHLFTLGPEGKDTATQSEIQQSMDSPDTFERHPYGIAESCQRVFVLAGELRSGYYSGQPHRQQFLITRDALETRARGE